VDEEPNGASRDGLAAVAIILLTLVFIAIIVVHVIF